MVGLRIDSVCDVITRKKFGSTQSEVRGQKQQLPRPIRLTRQFACYLLLIVTITLLTLTKLLYVLDTDVILIGFRIAFSLYLFFIVYYLQILII